ncbi:hypothetical protein [Aurantiacibacter sp. MUD61]|uniref:hypothetical protein n=1 Tax=Aurantiacibacter sp. MUD61 TaxID=3009083 RepID=UPI0022EFDA59|nr:hypothetical protein [Aurantiacibacter sp. MUD61]
MSGTVKIFIVAAAIIILIPVLILEWMNTALVHDPHNIVEAAYLDSSVGREPMQYIGFGWYYASIEGDSGFLVNCEGGRSFQGGYVTGHMGDTISVTSDCQYED